MASGIYAADGSMRVTQTDGAGNAVSVAAGSSSASNADTVSNTTTTQNVSSRIQTFNGTTWDRGRSIINATDSTGVGIVSAGLVAQLDETSPNAVTENQFGNLRITPSRALYVSNEGRQASYRACSNSFVPTVGGTMVQIQGSASKIIKITRISVSGSLTTGAVGFINLAKRTQTEQGSPTTGSAPVRTPLDSASAAATAVLTLYTTAGSGGTQVGIVGSKKVFFSATTAPGQEAVFDYGAIRSIGPIVLRGTSEFLCISSSFAAYTGADFAIDIEWTEE